MLMTGNEAVARGAFEAGITFASGYPGTPATEILESLLYYPEVYANWSVNEKTALEMASGVSFAGKRALVVMKHVGLNVAADPLMTLSYTGVRGGLVIAVSDDPGMHSSQNEQDSRLYSKMANIPMLEPSDSSEALVFTKEAFDISEKFDVPVLVRLTAAVSHSSSVADINDRIEIKNKDVKKEPEKYVMLPPYCNQRRMDLEKRWDKLRKFSESFPFNTVEYSNSGKSVITSGIAYHYVKEALPEASVLKLAMTNPFPVKLAKEFAKKSKEVFVVEELEPFMEDSLKIEGINVIGKSQGLSNCGELSSRIVKDFLHNKNMRYNNNLPGEGGSFCAGCPYLGLFYCLSKQECFVFGDIGCYTLGARMFPNTIDTTLCMGAGISQAAGFLKANPGKKAIALIGDSTFFHAGIPGVINADYHKIPLTFVVLDNRATAMTGGQPYAGIDFELNGFLKSIGVKKIIETCPYDISEIKNALKELFSSREISAIILKGKCVVKGKANPIKIDESLCSMCNNCLEIKCSALKKINERIIIDSNCIGCGLCVSLCERGAIG